MFSQLLGLPAGERMPPGLAAATLAAWQGARVIRTHDVRPTVECMKLVSAVLRAQPAAAEGT
jgi:dihydropteroate synthase